MCANRNFYKRQSAESTKRAKKSPCMLLRSVARVSSILSVWTRAVSTGMSEVNLDKCLEAAIEVAKRAGKVNFSINNHYLIMLSQY